MTAGLQLRFLLDEGVPVSVGQVLQDAGHEVIFFNQSGIAKSSADTIVCTVAEANEAILVAHDGDMKQIAKTHGITGGRFKALSLLKLECPEPDGATRVKAALSFIEHEWTSAPVVEGRRRLFIVISAATMRTHR